MDVVPAEPAAVRADVVGLPTIDLGDETPADLMFSLRRLVCPACGGVKRSGETVCHVCWYRMPRPFRLPLYRRIGAGYEDAFRRALLGMGVYRMYMPRPVQIPTPAEAT